MKKKKLLTLSLAAVMATSALPVSVLAEETTLPSEDSSKVENLLKEAVNVAENEKTEKKDGQSDPKEEANPKDKTEEEAKEEAKKKEEAENKLNAKKYEAIIAIKALTDLTTEEVAKFNKDIEEATDENAVKAVVEQAKAKNTENKTAKDNEKKEQELEQAKKDLASAVKAYEDLDKTIYTYESLKTYKDAYVAAKALDANAKIEKVKEAIKALKDARDNLKRKVATKDITGVKVYYNRIEGYAEPFSTVKLYKNGFQVGKDVTANSSGYFSISYSFGSSDYRYWNGYRYWDGTKYWDWDDYYRHYGYYPDRYYDGYYYNYYYNLTDFKLESYVGATLIDDYNVKNSDGYNYYNYYYDGRYYDRYYYNYDYKVYPTSLSLDSARDTVSGYLKSYPNRYVAVYRNGSFLGSSYVDSNGYFKVDLNTYIGSTSNLDFYVDRYYKTTTPKTTTTTTDTKTFRTVITIGSKNITQRINGADRTKTMDVEAYIKDGRTMLPIRFVAESLGYDVTYRNSSRSAIISDGKDIIIFYLDSADFYVNGVKKQFQVKPEIKNDRTMLPISEVARALGLTHGDKGSGRNIEWDNATRTVVIELKK